MMFTILFQTISVEYVKYKVYTVWLISILTKKFKHICDISHILQNFLLLLKHNMLFETFWNNAR